MTNAATAAEVFKEAARLSREDPLLNGSLLVFPPYGQVVMTGDLHGHRRNFEKLRQYCALQHAGARHVVLHEIIHEDVETLGGQDNSHHLFLEVARWKCEFPDQIHFLLSNHELAQVQRHEITKNGRVVTQAYEDSVLEAYGTGGDDVLAAMEEFILAFALAGRTANRVFLSHSLPSARDLATFDPTLLTRATQTLDLQERGSAHALVWGRYQTEAVLEALQEMLDVDYFICGHQPQEQGYKVIHDRMLILASEHNHGVFLPLDLKKPATMDALTRHIRPFAGVAIASG